VRPLPTNLVTALASFTEEANENIEGEG
jgi:hypothetical protein